MKVARRRFDVRRIPMRAQLYRRMMVVAMLASKRGLHEDARRLYALLRPMARDKATYRACRALAETLGGNGHESIARITAWIEQNPADDFSKAILGAAMLLGGHPDGRFTLENVLATSIHQRAREAARGLLELAPQLPPPTAAGVSALPSAAPRGVS